MPTGSDSTYDRRLPLPKPPEPSRKLRPLAKGKGKGKIVPLAAMKRKKSGRS